jgi:calcium-dependent protein kinase
MHGFYRVERELGRGANGVVSAVVHRQSGRYLAVKTIPKKPTPDMDEAKQAAHLAAIQREIVVMKALRSCLNVARLEEVFEDDDHIHIIQEMCTGGELDHSIGQRHYSERTVWLPSRAAPPEPRLPDCLGLTPCSNHLTCHVQECTL